MLRLPISDLLSSYEVSKLLNIPQGTVAYHARKGVIPCIRVCRVLRFKREDIEAIVNGTGEAK